MFRLVFLFSLLVVCQHGVAQEQIWFSDVVEDSSASDGVAIQPGLTLDDCIAIALKNQPALRIQRENTHIAREQVDVARSNYFPQIKAEARLTTIDEVRSFDIDGFFDGAVGGVFADAAAFFQLSRQFDTTAALNALDNPDTPIFPGGPSFNSVRQQAAAAVPSRIRVNALGETFVNSQIRLVQPLWTAGRIKYRVDQSRYGVQFASLAECRLRQELEFNVTRAYLAVLLSRHLRTVAEESAGNAEQLEEFVEDLVNSDDFEIDVTRAELEQVKAAQRLLAAQVPKLTAAEGRAKAALLMAMGLSQTIDAEVADELLEFKGFLVDGDQTVGIALANRPEINQAIIGIRVAKLEYQVATAEFKPQVLAFGQFSSIHDDRGFANPNDDVEWAGGVAASWELSTGGRRRAQSRIAAHKATQARAVLSQAKQLVEREAREAFLQYQQAIQETQINHEAFHAAGRAYQLLEDKEDANFIDPGKEKEHVNSKVVTIVLYAKSGADYYQSLYNYLLSLSRLQLVTGSKFFGEPTDPQPDSFAGHDHATDAG